MSFDHHIFVDFENVREADLTLLEGHSAAITLVLGKHQKTMALAMVEALRRLPAEQVILVQSPLPGKNALDFVLACLVGRVVERQPEVAVHVVSRDKGFDALIAHLNERGTPAARHESLADVPALGGRPATAPASRLGAAVTEKPAPKTAAAKKGAKPKAVPALQDRLDCLQQRLAKIKAVSRPQKSTALAAFIKSQFGTKMTERLIKETIKGMEKRGLLRVVPDGKVAYTDVEVSSLDEDDLVPF